MWRQEPGLHVCQEVIDVEVLLAGRLRDDILGERAGFALHGGDGFSPLSEVVPPIDLRDRLEMLLPDQPFGGDG